MTTKRGVLTCLALTLGTAGFPLVPASAVNQAQPVLVSSRPGGWTPHVLDGAVTAIVQVGRNMVVGGSFSSVMEAGSQVPSRHDGLFAFDARNGVVDPSFSPTLDGAVEALAPGPDGQSVYVGGRFSRVDGAPSPGIARLDVSTGRPVPGFAVSLTGSPVFILSLVLRGRRLYLGGAFTGVNGAERSQLSAVDPETGAVDGAVDLPFTDPRKGNLRVAKLDVSPDGSKLVAIGDFTRVAGQDRAQIAVADVGRRPARLADWETDRYKAPCTPAFDTDMRGVDFSPDGSYFVVVTTGAFHPGTLCDTVARWETEVSGGGLQPSWADIDGGDSFTAVAVTGTAVYVAGHNRWMNNPHPHGTSLNATPGPGGVPRFGIAALDPANGLPYSWNPGRARGEGAWALLATPDGLWVGSDTTSFANEYHARLAFCPLAGGSPVPPALPGRLPGELLSLGLDGRLTRRHFDGARAGAPSGGTSEVDWSHSRGAFMLSGTLYRGEDDGTLSARSFDGTTVGPSQTLDLHGLSPSDFPLASVTGMFFDRGRLYYSVAGDPRLFFRFFTPESGVVGAETFVASGNGDGFAWSDVKGLTLAGGYVYFARSNGNLYRANFSEGRPVANTVALVSAPDSGTTWASHGLFVLSTSPN